MTYSMTDAIPFLDQEEKVCSWVFHFNAMEDDVTAHTDIIVEMDIDRKPLLEWKKEEVIKISKMAEEKQNVKQQLANHIKNIKAQPNRAGNFNFKEME